MRDSFQGFFLNMFRDELNEQLRVTKSSNIVLSVVTFSLNRGDNSYMRSISTVLGGGEYKTM